VTCDVWRVTRVASASSKLRPWSSSSFTPPFWHFVSNCCPSLLLLLVLVLLLLPPLLLLLDLVARTLLLADAKNK